MFPNKVTVFIPIKRAIIAKAKMHQQINLQNSLVSGNVIEITNFRDEKTYTWNSTNFNKRKKALQTLQVKKVFFFFEAIITMASEIKNCFGTVFNQVFFSLTERENNELGRNWNENNFLGSAWQSDNFTWKTDGVLTKSCYTCFFSVLNREKEQNTTYRINDGTHSY